MATTVGQHGVATFTTPSNGDALDANVVKGNDNTTRDAYVAHDSDSGIHIQSSLLAARPAAGTVGRKWMTTDTANVKLFYDNGSAWENLDYLPTAGNVAITGDLTVAGTTTLTGTVGLPSGTILTSPSLLGTMTGGTLTPSTLTVPSGTTIPTHTETGTITATGSTRNNGTLTGATLNNTTFTGTITGINTTPVAYSATLGSSVAVTYSVNSTVLTLSSVPAGTYLVTAMLTGISQAGAGSSLGGYASCTNTVNASIAYGAHMVTGGVTTVTYSVPITMVVTLASTGDLQLKLLATGSVGTPYALAGAAGQTFISALKIQ
jgi:hypothetical protein